MQFNTVRLKNINIHNVLPAAITAVTATATTLSMLWNIQARLDNQYIFIN